MFTEEEKFGYLGKNIAKQRKLRKLSQFKMAEMLDISREHLAKIETAKRGISLSLLFKFSEMFDVPEKVLFDFTDYE